MDHRSGSAGGLQVGPAVAAKHSQPSMGLGRTHPGFSSPRPGSGGSASTSSEPDNKLSLRSLCWLSRPSNRLRRSGQAPEITPGRDEAGGCPCCVDVRGNLEAGKGGLAGFESAMIVEIDPQLADRPLWVSKYPAGRTPPGATLFEIA